MFTVAASGACPHCKRFIDIVNRVPQLQQRMNILTDAQKMKTELGVTHVPTVIDSQGKKMVGEQAFVWLKGQIKALNGNPDTYGLADVSDGSEGGVQMRMAVQVGIGILCAIGAFMLVRRMVGKSAAAAVEAATPALEDAGF